MWVDWKDEETLLSDKSDCCGFSSKIEIDSNLWIKVWNLGISWEGGWSYDLGSGLGDFVVVFTRSRLGVGYLEWDLEFGADIEGEWLFRWYFDVGSKLFSIHSWGPPFSAKNVEGLKCSGLKTRDKHPIWNLKTILYPFEIVAPTVIKGLVFI